MNDADGEKISNMVRTVVVKPGDTLTSIAAQFYDDESLAADLANINGIATSAILTIGKRIKVPHRAIFTRKRLPYRAAVAGLGDDPVVIDPSVQSGVPLVTVTASRPWYLQTQTWVIVGVGAVLAYILLQQKKKNRK